MLKSATQPKRTASIEQPAAQKSKPEMSTGLFSRIATITWLAIGEITGKKRNLSL